MASTDFLFARNLAAKGVVGQVTSDTPIAIRIRHTSSSATVTSVTVTTGTNIVLIDSDGTTTSTFATDTTIGAVADRINAANNWECKILDSLRSDASSNSIVDGVITAGVVDGVSYYDALVDTSAALHFSYRLTVDRGVGVNKPRGSHAVHLQEIQYSINVGTAGMDNLQVFELDGTVETQVLKGLNVDTTATTVNWASGEGKISAKDGNDILVRIKDAALLADSTSNYLTVIGIVE